MAATLCLGFLQPAVAQPLQFFKNYFVTGDYAVAGVGLAGKGVGGTATGTISITTVPSGADVVAAFLYWETVESTALPSSANGSFGAGDSIYPIAGTAVGTQTPPCWSAGGATGSSQGTVTLRVYRADVRPYLPVDPATGRQQANGSFQVSLPDSGSTGNKTPITEGASLVIVYRILSPAVPLRAVVLYNGSFTMNTANPQMSQTIQGFYQALGSSSARLTHIVGNGQLNFTEQLLFQGSVIATNPFQGAQDPNWDNFTSVVSVADNASQVQTVVQPVGSNFDCLSWGAIVFSTLVKNTDGDGLLDVWKQNHGYTDLKDGSFVTLPGATSGQRDLFVEVDYMCSAVSNGVCTGHSHLPKQAALDMIGQAFLSAPVPIHVHFDVGPNNYQNGDPYIVQYPPGVAMPTAGGNMIDENDTMCQDSAVAAPKVCEFPNQPGVVSWKGGFGSLKNQSFQHGRKDSYRYVLSGHTLGLATTSWSVALGTLASIVNNGTTATVTTSIPHGLNAGARVTISGALADFDLNGTYLVQSAPAPSLTTFNITTANVSNGTYSNWGLAVGAGPAKSTSGWSDLGGGDTIVTLGQWLSDIGADNQVGSVQVQAGTLMHELGHTLGLTHGGTYGSGPATFGVNCKPNFQSVMNYLFQIRGLSDYSGFAHVDYSGQALPDLGESALGESAGLNASTPYQTRWYAPLSSSFLDKQLQTAGGRAAARHCNGTLLSAAEVGTMIRVDGPLAPGPIDWNDDGKISKISTILPAQDINFNGAVPDATFSGFNDWMSLDLRQMGARRNAFGFSGDIGAGDLLGGGGGDLLGGGGGDLLGGGGGDLLGGGGGDLLGGGGGDLLGGGGGEEVNDFDLANSTVDPPTGFTAVQPPGAHSVNLNWNPPNFGRIRIYYIWRANTTNGPISATNLPTKIGQNGSLNATAPPLTTFTDPNVKNNNTYTYFVTAALGKDSGPNGGNQSGPSNMVAVPVKF